MSGNRPDLLPPLVIMARWRAEGFSPEEIRRLADTWVSQARQALGQMEQLPHPAKLTPVPAIPRRFRLRRQRVLRRGRKPRPEPVEGLAYKKALELVARIDEDLSRGTVHYRTRAGVLLTTLDEVVRAIIADDCQMVEGSDYQADRYRITRPKAPRQARKDKRLPDDQKVLELREKYSLTSIAGMYGVSKQAVSQAIKRALSNGDGPDCFPGKQEAR